MKHLLIAMIVSKNDDLSINDIKQGMRGKLGYVYTIIHYGPDHEYVKRLDNFLNQLNHTWSKYIFL